jgi:transposase
MVFRAAGHCAGCRARDRLLAQLRQQIAEMQEDYRRLQRRLARIKKDNDRLRAELDEMRRQSHRQANPFCRAKLKKRKKKPGRRRGHAANLRPTPKPEHINRVVNVPCRLCPDCGVPLVDPGQVVQYQTDLPPIVPIITQFTIETGFCPCCRQRVQGRHAEQTSDAIGAAGNTLGPVVLTMAAELKHRLGVPYRKISDFLETYADLKVCPSAFIRADQRLAERAHPTYKLLIDALRRSDIVHADETGWRVNAVNGWLWVFSNQNLTVYTIRSGDGARGADVPKDILGPDFDGILIVDGLKTYNVLDYRKGQCNAHLLRRTKGLQDTVPTEDRDLVDELQGLVQEAIGLAERRQQLTPEGYTRRVANIENRLEAWLLRGVRRRRPLCPEVERLIDHVAEHYYEWFVFLHEPKVPPTNNHAERMLRPAVITRKVGGCNKTLFGALAHSILASVMVTCKQQGQKFLELARKLWASRTPAPIPLIDTSPPLETAASP